MKLVTITYLPTWFTNYVNNYYFDDYNLYIFIKKIGNMLLIYDIKNAVFFKGLIILADDVLTDIIERETERWIILANKTSKQAKQSKANHFYKLQSVKLSILRHFYTTSWIFWLTVPDIPTFTYVVVKSTTSIKSGRA